MIETIIILTLGILALFCLNLYESVSVPISYSEKMRRMEQGFDLALNDGDTGSTSRKKFFLSEMESVDIKNLEKDLTSRGLNQESTSIHEYRKFRVEKKIRQRIQQRNSRARMKDIASRNGLDFSEIPLKNLDAFILETVGRPLRIIGYE